MYKALDQEILLPPQNLVTVCKIRNQHLSTFLPENNTFFSVYENSEIQKTSVIFQGREIYPDSLSHLWGARAAIRIYFYLFLFLIKKKLKRKKLN